MSKAILFSLMIPGMSAAVLLSSVAQQESGGGLGAAALADRDHSAAGGAQRFFCGR
ncbi:MAG: hypothetical protein M5U34_41240 [Chloroflexi bacterium]|nr:hypothetical protein [Chloroflexota bacterium]